MRLVISGTTYYSALSDIEPVVVTPVLKGCRVTLEAPDRETWEAWLDRMIEVATDFADEGHWDVTRAIYADVERADLAAGKLPMVEV